MKNRLIAWAKRFALVSLGTTPALLWGGSPSCVSNTNVEAFYQAVGSASIQSLANTTGDAVGNDGNAIVVQPAANFLQGMWNNWVDWRVPDDPTFGSPFRT